MKIKITLRRLALVMMIPSLLWLTSCFKQEEVNLPMLNTVEVTDITSTTAKCVVTITDDGGGDGIWEKGVCWSTSSAPTILNNKTSNGAGTAGFTADIAGLLPNTAYYIRAYATNEAGTGYGEQLFFTTGLEIGDTYQGGIIAYILQPWDTNYVSGEFHGLIVAPDNQQGNVQWGCMGTLLGGTSTALGTGQANTTAILSACTQSGTAAQICDLLVLNGYNDWYLPSKDELNLVFINRNAIGGSITWADYLWTSSESGANFAWTQFFNGGSQSAFSKDGSFIAADVRAVRSF